MIHPIFVENPLVQFCRMMPRLRRPRGRTISPCLHPCRPQRSLLDHSEDPRQRPRSCQHIPPYTKRQGSLLTETVKRTTNFLPAISHRPCPGLGITSSMIHRSMLLRPLVRSDSHRRLYISRNSRPRLPPLHCPANMISASPGSVG